MPDIFISYNREDQATARRFAEAFQAEGLDVWWDTTLRAGEAYDQVTEKALKTAKAVVVLWSKRSVDSRWVRAEATLADRNKTLVPVTIEPCDRPIMFELTQTAELSHWEGDVRDSAWQVFMGDLKRFVQAARSAPIAEPEASRPLTQPPVRAASRVSICVLPFANMSGDPEQEYFADGISEDIITDLSKVSALSVIARNSAFAFKAKNIDILQVARQLSVTHVLEGSVRKAGNRVRITAQLINGSTNDHVWADRWDRELDDIFALQDEISQAIVAALKLKLLPEEKQSIEDRGTTNLEAYDTYLRARALNFSQSDTEISRAIELYRRVVQLDPTFAQGWAGLAGAIGGYFIFHPELIPSMRPEMEGALGRAAELAPGLPEVLSSQLFQTLTRYDWAAADALLMKGIKAVGDNGTLGLVISTLGRPQEAVKAVLPARQASPLSLGVSFQVQFALDLAGRFDEADREYLRSQDLPGPRASLEWRAVTRLMPQRDDRLRQRLLVFQRCEASEAGGMIFMPFLPDLIEVLEQPEAALAIVRAAFDRPDHDHGARLGAIAHWAQFYGDTDLALAALRKAYVELRGITLAEIWHPVFAELRRDPRFKDIVAGVGLADHWRETGRWGDFARPVGDDDFEIIG